jgi:hypothetical protein
VAHIQSTEIKMLTSTEIICPPQGHIVLKDKGICAYSLKQKMPNTAATMHWDTVTTKTVLSVNISARQEVVWHLDIMVKKPPCVGCTPPRLSV